MAALHQLWAYITLGVSPIITEEATPLIGGLMAHDRYLRLSTVMFSIAIGTWLADLGLYYVGRWQGRWARQRWPRPRAWMARTFLRGEAWRSRFGPAKRGLARRGMARLARRCGVRLGQARLGPAR